MPDGVPNTATSSVASAAEVPYSSVLQLAFQKLTSQVLIFLLAYVILIIGVEFYGHQLGVTLRALFYLIPILGVSAYVFLERRKVAATDPSISVSAGWVSQSTVEGVRGDLPKVAGHVAVRSGVVTRGATVRGVDASPAVQERAATDIAYLQTLFMQLDESKRRRLIRAAADLIDEQGNT